MFTSILTVIKPRKLIICGIPEIPGSNLEPEPRQFFNRTCYFNPHIVTDKNGEAVVRFKLPHYKTNWRATAYANTIDSSFGQADVKIKVSGD